MLDQCWALIVLKFRLMRATWTGVHGASLVITLLTTFAMLVLSLGASIGLFFLGWKLLPEMKDPIALLGVLDALVLFYSFFWAWGLLMELQRSEVIDLRKLLFLPISPGMVFGLNFVASLFGPSMIFFLPTSAALILGLAMHYGPQIIVWCAPLAIIFFLMLGAWAHYVRGWLAVMMQDKRRRRLILTILPIAFVVLGQVPGMISATLQQMKFDPESKAKMQDLALDQVLLAVNHFFPPAWLPYGAWSTLHGDYRTAAACMAGCVAVAALGLLLGYLATLRFYRGHAGGRIKASKRAARRSRPLTARRLPFADEDTSALVAASFLSYLRHPNIRMLIIMPLCMGFLILFMYRSGVYGPGGIKMSGVSEWAPMVVLVWPFFNFSYVLFNIFGIDRESFRGLILLPTARYKYLLARNLALFPFVGGMSIAFVIAGSFLLDIPGKMVAVSVFQVVQLFLLYTIIGNVVSIYMPHQIGWNGQRTGSSRVLMMCVGILSAALLGVLMLPTTLCFFIDDVAREMWHYEGFSLGIPVSVAFLAVTLCAYFFSLRHAGDLLFAREQRVLDRLLRDRE